MGSSNRIITNIKRDSSYGTVIDANEEWNIYFDLVCIYIDDMHKSKRYSDLDCADISMLLISKPVCWSGCPVLDFSPILPAVGFSLL